MRVLGDKSPDGTKVTAEQIVTGAFRTIGGTVVSADAAKGEITLKDLDTKKEITIKTTADSQLRKLSPQAAMMLAMRLNPDAAAAMRAARQSSGEAPGANRGFQRPAGAGAANGERPRWGGGNGAPDMQQMLERMPTFTLAELKPGDPLIVASTVGANESTMTAITVLYGVDPILRAAPRGQLSLGTWSLEMQMPE